MVKNFVAWVLCTGVLLPGADARAYVHADPDPWVGAMAVSRAPIEAYRRAQESYFNQPVPRIVHRIAFGPSHEDSALKVKAWRAYAAQMGYRLRVWGPADLPELATYLDSELSVLVAKAWSRGQARFVAQVVRTAVLTARGGIFVDEGLWPPHAHGRWVDFSNIAPLEGLVLTTEQHGRDFGRASLFATDSIVMVAPGHPVLRHMLQSLPINHAKLKAHGLAFADGYDAGVFVLNRAVAGTLTVITNLQWRALGVVGGAEGAIALSAE